MSAIPKTQKAETDPPLPTRVEVQDERFNPARDDLLLALAEFVDGLPQNCLAARQGVEPKLRTRIKAAAEKLKAK